MTIGGGGGGGGGGCSWERAVTCCGRTKGYTDLGRLCFESLIFQPVEESTNTHDAYIHVCMQLCSLK